VVCLDVAGVADRLDAAGVAAGVADRLNAAGVADRLDAAGATCLDAAGVADRLEAAGATCLDARFGDACRGRLLGPAGRLLGRLLGTDARRVRASRRSSLRRCASALTRPCA
jgi:hypothetical protein